MFNHKNIRSIQSFQNIAILSLYITNQALNNDLQIKTINRLPKRHYKSYHMKLSININPLVQRMT